MSKELICCKRISLAAEWRIEIERQENGRKASRSAAVITSRKLFMAGSG